MAKKRYRTSWGASAKLQCELDIYRYLIDELKWNFSFIVTLSESDYPVKYVNTTIRISMVFIVVRNIKIDRSKNYPNLSRCFRIETSLVVHLRMQLSKLLRDLFENKL